MPVAMMRTRVLMAPAMGGRRGLGSNEITLAQERPPQGDPQTPQGIHFTGLEAMLSTDRMWRSRLFGGTRTLPSLPERDFLGVSLVIRGFRDSNRLGGLCAGRPTIRYFRSAVIGITVSAEARPAESSLKVPFQTLFGIFRDRNRQN